MICQPSQKAIMVSLMHLSLKTISCVGLPLLCFFSVGFILADIIYLHFDKSQMEDVCRGLMESCKAVKDFSREAESVD